MYLETCNKTRAAIAGLKNRGKVTIIRIELKIGTNVGNTIIKEMSKVPIAPISAKKVIQGKMSGKWVFRIFQPNGKFYQKNRSDKNCRACNSL
jgi:hypothetical protein